MRRLHSLIFVFLCFFLVSCDSDNNTSDINGLPTIEEWYSFSYYGDLFSEGLLPVKTSDNHEWGYINESGEIEITPKFKEAFQFNSNGIAIVITSDGNYNFINKDGDLISQTGFVKLSNFTNHTAVFYADREYGLISDSGERSLVGEFTKIVPTAYEDRYVAIYNNAYALIDKSGNILTDEEFDNIEPFEEEASIAVVERNDKFGLINLQGEIVANLIYDEIEINYKQSSASVMKDDLYGLLDSDGEVILDVQNLYYHITYTGLNCRLAAFVSSENLLGFIDEEGNVVIEPRYESWSRFRYSAFANGLQLLRDSYRGDSIIFNEFGQEIKNIGIRDNVVDFDDELYVMHDERGYKIFDFEDNLIFSSSENEIMLTSDSTDYFFVKHNYTQTYDIYDYDLNVISENCYLDYLGFINGLILASSNGSEWGFMDGTGEYVIEEQFHFNEGQPVFFDDGYAIFRGNQDIIIDRYGNVISDRNYEDYRYN